MANKNKNTEQFIAQSKILHNNKYDYSKSVYTGKYNKVIIICPIHGEFLQQARCHTNGKEGCLKCQHTKHSIFMIKSNDKFIEDAKKKHGNRYNYSLVNYINSASKIEVICKYHGVFKPVASDHLRGAGCPTCNNYSNYLKVAYKGIDTKFLKELTGYFYIIRLYNDNELFYKVGISKNVNHRIKEFAKSYKVDILYTEENYLIEILRIENQFLTEFKSFKYKPLIHFCGSTECLTINPLEYYYENFKKC